MIKIEGEVVVKDPKLDKSIGAFKSLQNEIKQARNELAGLEAGTEEYSRAAVKVGQLRDQMNDLKDTIAQTSGSPMENLNSSFTILSSQVNSLDFEGVGQSLSTLFTTIAANPFIALAGAITLVIQNFDSLKKLIPFLTENIIDNSKAVEANKIAYEQSKIVTDKYIDTLENERRVLELNGASRSELAKIDKEIRDERVKQLNLEISERQKNLESLRTQSKKEVDQLTFIKNVRLANFKNETVLAEARLAVAKANQTTQTIKAEEAAIKDLISQVKLLNAEFNASQKVVKPKIEIEPIPADQLGTVFINPLTEANNKANQQMQLDNDTFYQNALNSRSNFNVMMGQLVDGLANESFEVEANLAKGIQGLSQIVYQQKAGNLKKGSKEEIEAARKAFEVEKALRIANATTAGIEGGIQAFTRGTSLGGPILGGIFAAAAAASALAGILQIKNTKFNPSSPSAPSSNANYNPTITNSPNVPLPTAPRTRLDEQGRPINENGERPYVSVKEINKKQERVDVLETRSSY